MNQKGLIGLILLIVILIIGVGAGAYYFGNVNNKTQPHQVSIPAPTDSSSQNNPTSSPIPSPVVTTTSKSVQLQKTTAVSGNETINLIFQIPSNWTLQTVAKTSNPSDLIKNCSDFVMTSPSSTKLVISPICGGWSANYSPIPQNQVTIMGDTIRYSNSGNQYTYVDTDRTSNKMMDSVLIKYGNNFIPTHISLSSTDNLDIQTSDQIISSLKASAQ